MKSSRPRRRILVAGIVFGLLTVSLFVFSSPIYGFLAVPTVRVEADIVVVEGWVPSYVVRAAADEFARGGYKAIVTSGLELEGAEKTGTVDSAATEAALQLEQMGIASTHILICPTPLTNWNKTAKSSRVVTAMLDSLGIHPKGVNVVTIGVHARRTWLAYQHAFGPQVSVGIIQIPEITVNPARWWASSLGIKRVTKGYVAWVRERFFGSSP
jgi:hypothetical protein